MKYKEMKKTDVMCKSPFKATKPVIKEGGCEGETLQRPSNSNGSFLVGAICAREALTFFQSRVGLCLQVLPRFQIWDLGVNDLQAVMMA